MMFSTLPKPQKYLAAAHAGALVLAGGVAAYAFDVPDFFKGLPVGMLLAIIFILFKRQLRDEYIERLWNAGTAAAFLMALASTLGVELVRGFTEKGVEMFATRPLLTPLEVGALTLAAFFTAFHVELWRHRA